MLEENIECTTVTDNGRLMKAICLRGNANDTASVFYPINDTTFYTKYFYENGKLEKEGARHRISDNIFGTWIRYYKSGNMMDSIIFNKDGTADRLFKFSENGELLKVDSNGINIRFDDL